MIPLFPQFKRLELSDEGDIQSITNKMLPYSDFNFVSLWCYDVAGQTMLSQMNGNLIIRFADYIMGDSFYSFIGANKSENTIDTLLKFSQEELGVNHLKLVPSHSLKTIVNRDEYTIVEERGAFDYIYDLAETYRYKGSSLKQKRHLVNHFIKKYDDVEVSILDLSDIQAQNDILDITKMSVDKIGDDLGHDNHEVATVMRLIELVNAQQRSNIIVLGVYISGELVTFNITEVLRDQWSIVHFEKGNFRLYPEAGAYVFYELMEILAGRGVRYINLEQDLDIDGLRMNKLSFRPSGFLKKYKIQKV